MIREPLIHIGYHKTGTTWLQRELFGGSHPAFWPVDPSGSNPQRLARPFYSGDGRTVRGPFDDVRPRVDAMVRRVVERGVPTDRVPVISHERLSGNPHTGGFDAARIAEDLAACFADARVLIVIREQRQAILSAYLQYLKVGGTDALEGYLSRPYDGRRPGFAPDHFRYLELIETYRRLLGVDRVLVLPYASLRDTPEAFFGALGAFVGQAIDVGALRLDARHNATPSRLVATRTRLLGLLGPQNSLNGWSPFATARGARVVKSTRQRLARLVPPSVEAAHVRALEGQVDAWAGDRYAASNGVLEQRLGLDLAAIGYRVARD